MDQKKLFVAMVTRSKQLYFCLCFSST